MGIAFSAIQKMDDLGLFGKGRVSILDIGSSNLYSATAESVEGFMRKYGAAGDSDAEAFAARLAAGSSYDPVSGGRNEAFVGELFERVGMQYMSFDIANGYRTTILDLNHAVLPPQLRRKFDLVLNFGTTEHILNQLNCFRVIHDATRLGGYIYHSLPAVGYVDHGYVTYTGRCFFDVAGYNEYELVDCWFDGPGGGGTVLDSLQSYSSYFPALRKALERLTQSEEGRTLRELRIPDIGINVVYRKVKDKPFWGALESSTSVGEIPRSVSTAYQGGVVAGNGTVMHAAVKPTLTRRLAGALGLRSPQTSAGAPLAEVTPRMDGLTSQEAAIRDRLLSGSATLGESLQLYNLMVGRGLEFPLDWEERVLQLGLAAEPDRADLKARLEHLRTTLDRTNGA